MNLKIRRSDLTGEPFINGQITGSQIRGTQFNPEVECFEQSISSKVEMVRMTIKVISD